MVVFTMVNKYKYTTMINNMAVYLIFNNIGQEKRNKLSFYNIVRFRFIVRNLTML